MASNQAAWLTAKGARPLSISAAPMPVPTPGEVVLKVHAIAINPVDAGIQNLGILVQKYPHVLGSDVAGVVTAVGSAVKGFEIGDRVTGFTDFTGARENVGSFQLYCAVLAVTTAKLPEHVSFREGSVLPLALSTAGDALFGAENLALHLPELAPTATGQTVLVWGAASSVGACAVQMLKAAGYAVVATCSPRNFGFCAALGAERVFDARGATVVQEIVAALRGSDFAGAFDAVMPPDTIVKCAQIADAVGGKKFVNTVIPPGSEHLALPEGLPAGVEFGFCNSMSLQTNELGPAIWGRWLGPALASGLMKCKPDPHVVGKGLESLQDALDRMAEGASAQKFVVEIE